MLGEHKAINEFENQNNLQKTIFSFNAENKVADLFS